MYHLNELKENILTILSSTIGAVTTIFFNLHLVSHIHSPCIYFLHITSSYSIFLFDTLSALLFSSSTAITSTFQPIFLEKPWYGSDCVTNVIPANFSSFPFQPLSKSKCFRSNHKKCDTCSLDYFRSTHFNSDTCL